MFIFQTFCYEANLIKRNCKYLFWLLRIQRVNFIHFIRILRKMGLFLPAWIWILDKPSPLCLTCFLSADVLQEGFSEITLQTWVCTKKISKLCHGFFFFFNNIDWIEINFLLALWLVFLYKPSVLLYMCLGWLWPSNVFTDSMFLDYCPQPINISQSKFPPSHIKRIAKDLTSKMLMHKYTSGKRGYFA